MIEKEGGMRCGKEIDINLFVYRTYKIDYYVTKIFPVQRTLTWILDLHDGEKFILSNINSY